MDNKMEQRNILTSKLERDWDAIYTFAFYCLKRHEEKTIHEEGQVLVSFPSNFNYIPKIVNVDTFA